ncbi:MAG: phosphoadenylyl-sulfate reductase [Planctomycetota bacterium]
MTTASSQPATPTAPPKPELDLDALEADLSKRSAADIVGWASETFGDRAMLTTSFGVQAAVMLHLVASVKPDIPVVFIDTGFHFQETYAFADTLSRRLDLNLRVYQPELSPSWFVARHGKLWEGQSAEQLNRYDAMRKVEPMQRALAELDPLATFAGLRKQQTAHRQNLRHVELQDGRYKVSPILRWSTKDVHQYLKAHDLPYHPLHDQGYASVGDWHSTRPIGAGDDERSGRFNGLKQECGLHLPTSEAEDASRASSDL